MAYLAHTWKVLGAVAALATVLSACQAGAPAQPGATSTPSAATAQLVEARMGPLRSSVTATGGVVFAQQDQLTFGSTGAVKSVSVTWGQSVKKGDILAQLDTTSLVLAVSKAQHDLESAQAALNKANYTPGDLAQATAAVATAQAQVDSAQAALNTAKRPYTDADLAKAQAAANSAQAAVQAAQTALDTGKKPYTPGDLAKADATANSAQAAVQTAQAALNSAQAGVGTAQAALDKATAAQAINLANAKGAVADAQLALAAAQRSQASVRIQQDSLVRQAQDTLDNARTTYANNLRTQGYTVPDGDDIYNYAPVSSLGAATSTASVTLYNNWRTLLNARDALIVARATHESAIANADNAALVAQRTLDSAQNDLNLLLAGSDQATIKARQADLQTAQTLVQSREADLQAAQATLKKAQDDQAGLKAAYDAANAADTATKTAALQAAQADLNKAKDDLATLKAAMGPVNAADLGTKTAALQAAQGNLKKAQENLQDIRLGADPVTLPQKQSAVAAASKALQDAQDNLDHATIKAPYDGIVTDVPAVPGQNVNLANVSANTVAVVMVDPKSAEVDALVSEVDVAQLRVGQAAGVTFDALPSVQLRGQVTSIAAVGTTTQGVVSYKIAISIKPPADLVLRQGMTSQATVQVAAKDNVLVVPLRAIRTQGGTKTVSVAVEGKLDGKIETRTVQVGLTTDTQAEIVSGLKAGEQVVVQGAARNNTGGFGFGGPGGLGGPGFRP